MQGKIADRVLLPGESKLCARENTSPRPHREGAAARLQQFDAVPQNPSVRFESPALPSVLGLACAGTAAA